MPRFSSDTFNTGSVSAGGFLTFNRTISSNNVNIGKIKVVPSGSTIGYEVALFKKADLTLRQWATPPTKIGNTYDPTDRLGNEVEEGWVIPYEDRDGTSKLHYKVTNHDPVARSYDITTWYEVTGVDIVTVANIVTEDLTSQIPSTTLTLANTPLKIIGIYRNGGLMIPGAGADYTISGTTITLAIPAAAGETAYAIYVK